MASYSYGWDRTSRYTTHHVLAAALELTLLSHSICIYLYAEATQTSLRFFFVFCLFFVSSEYTYIYI